MSKADITVKEIQITYPLLARCGNAVVPALVKVLVKANVYEVIDRELAS